MAARIPMQTLFPKFVKQNNNAKMLRCPNKIRKFMLNSVDLAIPYTRKQFNTKPKGASNKVKESSVINIGSVGNNFEMLQAADIFISR